MIPPPLLEDIAEGRCLPFIGAGFSLNARLPKGLQMPAWPELTETLANVAGVSPDLGGPGVASEFEKKFGHVQLIEAIRKALRIDVAKPGEAHMAFAELPFDTVYTTNFDLLLEEAYASARKPFRSLVGELQMPFHGGRLTTSVVKMHGDLRHEEHIIITKDDYRRFLRDYPVIATHLSAMLITKTPLFVGYSLSDPDFQHIRQVVRSRLGKFERMAYVIQFNVLAEEYEGRLSENLHIVSVKTTPEESKDEKLAQLFRTIQENLDVREGTRFRAARPDIFESMTEETVEATTRAKDASSLFASSSNLCFVMTPFRPEFDTIYWEFVKPAVEQFGLKVIRADEILAPGAIMEQIRSAIQQSRLCIADVSGQNPNVLYEVGFAHSLGKPTILMTKQINDVPFDLRSMRLIVYDPNSLEKAMPTFRNSVQNVLSEGRLEEAERLIGNGMYRAGVAMLGILLEFGFRELATKHSAHSGTFLPTRPMGLGQALRLLTDYRIIEPDDRHNLLEGISIRNKAVHELEEPQAQDARLMLDVVKRFIDKYLGAEFLKAK